MLRAIKAGRLSAQRDEQGGWQIDPAELHRVFPPLPAPATVAGSSAQRDAMADALVAELRAVIADLRQDRDRWREAFERAQRALPMPMQRETTGEATEKREEVSRFRRAWRWMRATGCLAGAGLLLALATVTAAAQQQQQQPQRECFTIAASNNPGAILTNFSQ